MSTRRPPLNLEPGDLWLFEHELERRIPGARLIEVPDVRVSADGYLFKGGRILPESFAFPDLYDAWKRRHVIRFLLKNYFLSTSTRIEADVVWIVDNWSSGYFHWLSDVLPRLLLVRQHLTDWTVLLPHRFRALGFVEPSLAPFGVRHLRYAGETEVLTCRRLFVPTHAAPSGHFNDEVIQRVQDVLVTAYGARSDAPADRLYISRAAAANRRLSNEGEVLDVLRSLKFRILQAESCSFEEQVRAASQSRHLVSNHGAGLTNMLFMRPGGHVLELRHHTDRVNNCYFTMASALGMNYSYQMCAPVRPEEDPHTADLLVDIPALEKNLERLLSGR